MTTETQLCGYGCGKPWRPWAGSKLRGHALCAASPELQDDVLAVLERFPQVGYRRIAADLGVTESVVTAWVRAAMRRRWVARRAARGSRRSW